MTGKFQTSVAFFHVNCHACTAAPMMKLTCHSRAGWNPEFAEMLDARLRGNDEARRVSR